MKLHVAWVSKDAAALFTDAQLNELMRSRGVDLSRPIRFVSGLDRWYIHYDDTFLGEGI